MSLGYRSYQYRPDLVDTSPGASAHCPFSPPPQFEGDGEEYIKLMRLRYRDPAHKRYMQDRISRFENGEEVVIVGAFSVEATKVLSSLVTHQNQKKTG